jgi:hypothetical protein
MIYFCWDGGAVMRPRSKAKLETGKVSAANQMFVFNILNFLIDGG